MYFDAVANASHVTFDDGKTLRRNISWLHYREARWEYKERDTIKVDIGNWLVEIDGHNLASLFQAIEEHTLLRACAHVEWLQESERLIDTFVTEIRFLKPPEGTAAKRRGPIEFDLGGLSYAWRCAGVFWKKFTGSGRYS